MFAFECLSMCECECVLMHVCVCVYMRVCMRVSLLVLLLSWFGMHRLQFKRYYKGNVKFLFPDAPVVPVTVNGGMRMPSWFDLFDVRVQEQMH